MTHVPRFAMVIGSTRPSRFADKPAKWLMEYASSRDDLILEQLDLRDFDLPFFAELAHQPARTQPGPKGHHVAGHDPAIRGLRLRRGRVQPLDHRSVEERSGSGLQ